MDKLFKIQAEITVNETGGRTWPIKSGYRPGFNFTNKGLTSGSINLLDKQELKPGEKGIVEVSFVSNELLGELQSGNEFKFYEGAVEIGIGEVIKVLGWV